MSADKKLKFESVATEASEINDLTDKIMAATNEFHRLHTRILTELPPWPRTQFEQSLGIRTEWSIPDSG